ncbi:MAG: tRNA pseudouridine synthase B [Rhodobiaceae bacterium UBA7378]|nr:MAG: tRNA pseudouridine synthase B [Rhodobiaceae bacterium UBA7378]|tara:strand:- start:1211 stop:2170 length:960 start_codon:yes stop_codon:yes gene_type:complete
MGRRRRGRDITGWINLDKPLGFGSTPAVSKVRRVFDAKKAGHAGTLDPLASGILPVALGEATKTVQYMQNASKVYHVTIAWGAATRTDDLEGEVTETATHRPQPADIAAALPIFTGDIMQVPPAFSAIRKDGARAYDLARAGEVVDLAPRSVRIDAITLLDCPTVDTCTLQVVSGKGVYIRSLARDLARYLGTFGHVTALRRTRVGPFDEKNAIGLEKLESLGHIAPDLAALDAHVLPLMTVLDDIPALAVSVEQASRIRQGQAISLDDFIRHRETGSDEREDRQILAVLADTPVAICMCKSGLVHPVRVFNFPPPGVE